MTKLGRTKDGSYRTSYLWSPAWRVRRRRFLAALPEWRCACLGEELTRATIDLHHVTYDGVTQNPDGSWVSGEQDADLIPVCRWCHERIHRLMDRDAGWSQRDRRAATTAIIRTIQRAVLTEALRQADGGKR